MKLIKLTLLGQIIKIYNQQDVISSEARNLFIKPANIKIWGFLAPLRFALNDKAWFKLTK